MSRVRAWIATIALSAAIGPAAGQQQRHILTTDHLRVRHWPEQAELGELARGTGNEALTRLERMLDIELEERVDVYIVRSQDEFNDLTGGQNKPWIIGRALPGRMRLVVKPMGPQRLPPLLAHELAHIMLDLRMGEKAYVLPRWLHEGIAKYAANDFDAADRQVIGQAALADELLTLDELEAFGGDRDEGACIRESYTLAPTSAISARRGISPLLDQCRGRICDLRSASRSGGPCRSWGEWLEGLRTGICTR